MASRVENAPIHTHPPTDVWQILESVLILPTCGNLEILFLPVCHWGDDRYFWSQSPYVFAPKSAKLTHWALGIQEFMHADSNIFHTSVIKQDLIHRHVVGVWPRPPCHQRQCAVAVRTASAVASWPRRSWSADSFPGGRCVSADIRSASAHRRRQPAHRSIPSPQQAMWILPARSARLCSAGGGRRWAAVYKNQQQSSHVLRHPHQWRHSSTVCGIVHMTDRCPITQDTWPTKIS